MREITPNVVPEKFAMPAAPLLMMVRRRPGRSNSRSAARQVWVDAKTSTPASACHFSKPRGIRRIVQRIMGEAPAGERLRIAMHDADARGADGRDQMHRQRGEARRHVATRHRTQIGQDIVRPRDDAVVDVFRISAAAACTDVARASDLGLDIAAHREVARHALLDCGEPVRLAHRTSGNRR